MGQPASPNRAAQRLVAQQKLKDLFQVARTTWPGFQERKSQKRAMGQMLNVLMDYNDAGSTSTGKNIAILEAGTGFGKTVGYGLPALAAAFASGKRVVLSTATVALQEQLYEKDLPKLAAVAAKTGFNVSFTLLKGRSRYVCSQKLDLALLGEATADEHIGGSTPAPQAVAQRVNFFASLADATLQKQWDGDRDKWPDVIDDGAWTRIQADRATCTGRRCPAYQDCSFYAARAGAKEANVIVANHSLVLATLANEASLFDPKETFFIFDEGHHLNAIATDHFAPRYGVESSRRAFQTIEKALARAVRLTGDSSLAAASETFRQNLSALAQCHNALGDELMENLEGAREPIVRFEHGVLPEVLQTTGMTIMPLLQETLAVGVDAMNILRNALGDATDSERRQITSTMHDLGPAVIRIQSMGSLWKQWLFNGKVPRAKWLSLSGSGRNREIELCASAMTSAGDLAGKLWQNVSAAIVASATLKVGGTFDYFKRTTGLARFPDTVELEAESPFDYSTQGEIHIVATQAPPESQAAFALEVQRLLPDFLQASAAGTLALFTSRKQMQASYDALPPSLRSRVLMQGAIPKSQLLAEHRTRIERGESSPIFGLQSFGEGVDLPGKLCEVVLIDRIPFKPPGNPTDDALAEWLKTQGRDPFKEITIPLATQTMKQWVGRAIRTTDDRARIYIFDSRLLAKAYGSSILGSLPPMPVFKVQV